MKPFRGKHVKLDIVAGRFSIDRIEGAHVFGDLRGANLGFGLGACPIDPHVSYLGVSVRTSPCMYYVATSWELG